VYFSTRAFHLDSPLTLPPSLPPCLLPSFKTKPEVLLNAVYLLTPTPPLPFLSPSLPPLLRFMSMRGYSTQSTSSLLVECNGCRPSALPIGQGRREGGRA